MKIFYEKKFFIISKYSSISNSNLNTVISGMNNKMNQVQILIVVTKYIILIINSNRNNIVNNSSISNSENKEY